MDFLRLKKLKFLTMIFLVLFLQSCSGEYSGNEKQVSKSLSGISYPDNGNFGKNLLSEKDFTISTNTWVYYSLRVDKEIDSSVKVIFPIPSGDYTNMWWWDISTKTGWYEGPDSKGGLGGFRHFITESGSTSSDLEISFRGSESVTIEIYENGDTTPTRTKTISW